MNFETISPVNFGSHGELTNDAPGPHTSAAKNRRFAALQEAGAILANMPKPGEALHAIMSGRYDLTDTLESILSHVGRVDHLRIATLSLNSRNVSLLQSWLVSKAVQKITLLYSLFFRAHSPEVVKELADVFVRFPSCRKAASRNHCKVSTLVNRRIKLSLEGSANLRTNSNREQFCLMNDAQLHDWHAAWIDAEISKHEAEEADFTQGQAEQARIEEEGRTPRLLFGAEE